MPLGPSSGTRLSSTSTGRQRSPAEGSRPTPPAHERDKVAEGQGSRQTCRCTVQVASRAAPGRTVASFCNSAYCDSRSIFEACGGGGRWEEPTRQHAMQRHNTKEANVTQHSTQQLPRCGVVRCAPLRCGVHTTTPTTQCNTRQYNTTQHSTAQHNTTQHSTTQQKHKYRSSTAHCPQAVRQCNAGVPLPTAPRQCGGALQEFHCPLPLGSEAVQCRSSTAHCPQAVRQCNAGVALPTAPRQ